MLDIILDVIVDITLDAFKPEMEDIAIFVLPASPLIPASVNLTPLISLTLALSFCFFCLSHQINTLQINKQLREENDQLIQDLEVAVHLGEQQLHEAQELDAALRADAIRSRVAREVGDR